MDAEKPEPEDRSRSFTRTTPDSRGAFFPRDVHFCQVKRIIFRSIENHDWSRFKSSMEMYSRRRRLLAQRPSKWRPRTRTSVSEYLFIYACSATIRRNIKLFLSAMEKIRRTLVQRRRRYLADAPFASASEKRNVATSWLCAQSIQGRGRLTGSWNISVYSEQSTKHVSSLVSSGLHVQKLPPSVARS